eukprot:746743-Hanusia_phi.AAC.1
MPLHYKSAAAVGYYVGGSSPLTDAVACMLTKLQDLNLVTDKLPVFLVNAFGKARCSLVEGKFFQSQRMLLASLRRLQGARGEVDAAHSLARK